MLLIYDGCPNLVHPNLVRANLEHSNLARTKYY